MGVGRLVTLVIGSCRPSVLRCKTHGRTRELSRIADILMRWGDPTSLGGRMMARRPKTARNPFAIISQRNANPTHCKHINQPAHFPSLFLFPLCSYRKHSEGSMFTVNSCTVHQHSGYFRSALHCV